MTYAKKIKDKVAEVLQKKGEFPASWFCFMICGPGKASGQNLPRAAFPRAWGVCVCGGGASAKAVFGLYLPTA